MGCQGSKAVQANSPAQIEEGDFKVCLDNPSSNLQLGLTITVLEKKYLLVEAFREEGGLVPSWNAARENTPETQVKPGDLIVAVNGVFGNSNLMLAQVKTKEIVLTVKRAKLSPEEAPVMRPSQISGGTCQEPAAEPSAGSPGEAAANPVAEMSPPAEDVEPAAAEAAEEAVVFPAPSWAALKGQQVKVDLAPESCDIPGRERDPSRSKEIDEMATNTTRVTSLAPVEFNAAELRGESRPDAGDDRLCSLGCGSKCN